MFVRLKNLAIAAIAGSIVVGAAGCTSEAETDEPTGATQSESPAPTSTKPTPSPTPKPTPTPVPASSKGPAQNWPVPVMPAVAKEKSEAGIVAFTEYWFELVAYSDMTNDTKPIKSVTQRSCYLCAEQIIDPVEQNKAVGAWRAGGAIDVAMTMAKVIRNDGIAGFSLHREEIVAYLSSGQVQGILQKTEKPMAGTLYLLYQDGWQVVDLDFISTEKKSE